MAAFTSVQNGNWNDGATWGNSSPGVKGTDWPGNAGDTASINHTVTYNVSETNTIGNIPIESGGVLTWKTDADTKLVIASGAKIWVKNGGECRIGVSGTPIDAAYTAEIIHEGTSNSNYFFDKDIGGKLFIFGDPDYYGSDYDTYLDANADNTDGDADIVTTDDMSAKWNAGDVLLIQVNYEGNSNCNTAGHADRIWDVAVIDSISGTTITCTGAVKACPAGVGSTWSALVLNMTRNVQIYKSGTSIALDSWSSSVPTLLDAGSTSEYDDSIGEYIYLSDVMLHNLYRIGSPFRAKFDNCSFSNMYLSLRANFSSFNDCIFFALYYALYSCSNNYFSGIFASCEYVLRDNANRNIIEAVAIGNLYVFYSAVGDNSFSGTIASNYYAFNEYNHIVMTDSYIHSNYYMFSGTIVSTKLIDCEIGYDSDGNSLPNTYDGHMASYLYFQDIVFDNVKLPSAGLVFENRGLYEYNAGGGHISCLHHNQVLNTHKIYDWFGDVIKTACDGTGDAPSVDPESGNGYCIELNALSNINEDNYLRAFTHKIWCEADTEITITYKIQTTYSSIAEGGLVLTAEYLDGVTGGSTTTETDNSAITERSGDTDWSQTLSVTITPQEDGWVTLTMDLTVYEENDEVYIWPNPEIS